MNHHRNVAYYIVAHVYSALHDPEPTLDIATQSPTGQWFLASGEEVWPYWTQPLNLDPPPIPEGWLDHLAALATTIVRAKPSPSAANDLLASLGLGLSTAPVPSPPINRRF